MSNSHKSENCENWAELRKRSYWETSREFTQITRKTKEKVTLIGITL